MAFDDFSFAWEGSGGPSGPWGQLQVLSFEGHEALSSLSRYEITLLAAHPDQEVDPAELIHRSATLRIKTVSTPAFKVVHGVIVEARELPASKAGQPYRVVLMPPLARATFRRRCRVFLDKTLRQIIEAVLTGDPHMTKVDGASVDEDQGLPSYAPAKEQLTWRLTDAGRADDPRARAYCVQYQESDLAFVSRLLEAEGISYHFENGDGVCLLVFSDADVGRARLTPDAVGPGVPGRAVESFAATAALRGSGVVLDEYEWKKPALDMTASAGGGDRTAVCFPGGYADSPAMGAPLARALLERELTEASGARGDGTIRVLSAGSIFALDASVEEHLVTALRVRGDAQGWQPIPGKPIVPFYAWFECARRGDESAPAESRFRPARATPRPRISGAQTAVVTAEPGSSAEIDVGGPDGLSIGCVRVKFHWDDDAARHAKEPTSCWVRVSQVFAGAGQGAVWHPRVGVEVIVTFEEGDPDRPIVTGRVYNGKNLPPYGGAPPISTFKSFSLPGGGQWNEVTFDDSAGAERVYVHAGKDETTKVNHHRLEQVGNDATMKVDGSDTEDIGADCSVTIAANQTLTVGADQTSTIGANSTVTIDGNSDKTVGGSESYSVGGDQTIHVGGSLDETVTGAVSETYQNTLTVDVTGAETHTMNASRSTTVAGTVDQTYGSHQKTIDGFRFVGVLGDQQTTTGSTVSQTYTGSLFNIVGGEHSTSATGGITRNTPLHLICALYSTKITPTQDTCKDFNLGISGIKLKATGVEIGVTGLKITGTGFKKQHTLLKLKPRDLSIDLIVTTGSLTSVYVCMTAIAIMI